MARRRMDDGPFADDGTRQEQGLGGDNTIDLQNPFGNGRDRPDTFYNLPPEEQQSIEDMQRGAVAGNTDSARDLNPQVPNTIRQSQPSAPAFNLPQGVSVNESMGGGGDYTQDAPAMPMSPAPAAGRPASPSFSQPESRPQPGGARRVSAAPSALFGQQGSTSMFGRAGGLLGGGTGVPGAGSDGEVDATAMFKKLLEQFGQA